MSLVLIPPVVLTDAILTSSNVPETDYAAWSATTAYAVGARCILASTHKIYESVLAQSAAAVTLTIAAPGVVSWLSHGMLDGSPVVFTTTGALPTGIVSGTTYYVKSPTVNAFSVAATVGGAAITTSGTQSGTHMATVQSNYNRPPATSATYWLAVSPTNKWKMFDTSNTSTTIAASPISIVLLPGQAVNAVALLGLVASSVRVRMTDPTAGTVYDKTTSVSGVITSADWYSYFFSVAMPLSIFTAIDLPAYPACSVLIDITNSAGNVQCATCVVGYQTTIGLGVNYGAKVNIIDYSVKTANAYGDYVLTQRAYSKRATFDMLINAGEVDSLQNLLAGVRATPCVWIGSDAYAATIVFGFYKDFSITIQYATASLCSLEIEGMT